MPTKTVEVTWRGDMRFASRTGSAHDVSTDDKDGDSAPRPTELVLAALAMCTGMDVVSILDKQRQDYETYQIHATAEQREEYPQIFTSIELVHEVRGPGVKEAGVRRCIELSATKYCPVSAMLAAGATEIHHRYRIAGTGPEPFAAEGEVLVTGPFQRPDVVE
ncbi:MAG TPA: OsmC family protein [Candidatus Limnocylindria bacterium]|nr:OsmC family protein [Candidatus Limnocylindria bacterium]